MPSSILLQSHNGSTPELLRICIVAQRDHCSRQHCACCAWDCAAGKCRRTTEQTNKSDSHLSQELQSIPGNTGVRSSASSLQLTTIDQGVVRVLVWSIEGA